MVEDHLRRIKNLRSLATKLTPANCSYEEWIAVQEAADEIERLRLSCQGEPIPMVLFCPACGVQHIDEAEEPLSQHGGFLPPEPGDDYWDNPPHRSHLCHGCGHIWRPADVPTTGVQAIQTKGKADSPLATGASCKGVEGWRMVPVEPTQAMLDAVCTDDPHGAPFHDDTMREVYKEMLRSAPVSPSPLMEEHGDG